MQKVLYNHDYYTVIRTDASKYFYKIAQIINLDYGQFFHMTSQYTLPATGPYILACEIPAGTKLRKITLNKIFE